MPLPSLTCYITEYEVDRNVNIVTIAQLLDAVCLSTDNKEKIRKISETFGAFLRGFMKRRGIEGHDVVKLACAANGMGLFPFTYVREPGIEQCFLVLTIRPL